MSNYYKPISEKNLKNAVLILRQNTKCSEIQSMYTLFTRNTIKLDLCLIIVCGFFICQSVNGRYVKTLPVMYYLFVQRGNGSLSIHGKSPKVFKHVHKHHGVCM